MQESLQNKHSINLGYYSESGTFEPEEIAICRESTRNKCYKWSDRSHRQPARCVPRVFSFERRRYSISAAESKVETFSRDRRHAVQGTAVIRRRCGDNETSAASCASRYPVSRAREGKSERSTGRSRAGEERGRECTYVATSISTSSVN